jgi:hypothetical protein
MITGIGISLAITGLLALIVVDNFKPECSEFKKNVIKALIIMGVTLIMTDIFL